QAGVSTYLELGPDATLTAMTAATLADHPGAGSVALAPTLRKDHPEPRSVLTAAATAHTTGHPITWPTTGTPTDLPPYPSRPQRSWFDPRATWSDPAALGQRCTEPPLLGAAVPLADSDSLIFTGRLSLRTHPWLADHAVHGACVLPGTAFADMALHAGDHV